jgi:hypothetical protein
MEPFAFPLLSKNMKIKINITTLFHFVLYGYETWSLTLNEEYGLKVCRE